MSNSRIAGFYNLSLEERRARLAQAAGLEEIVKLASEAMVEKAP